MADTLKQISLLGEHSSAAWYVSWNPTGNELASCGADHGVVIWKETANGDEYFAQHSTLKEHKRTVRRAEWSPCGNLIATASFDGTTCIWEKEGGGTYNCLATLDGHENEVKAVTWSVSGRFLATCSRDKSVWIWEVDEAHEFEVVSVQSVHSQDVKCVKWNPVKDELASGSYDNTIKLFCEDGDDWINFATLEGHESTIWGLAFESTGKRLASCSDDKTVKIWKEYEPGNEVGVATIDNHCAWKCVCTLSGFHDRVIYDIDWSHLNGLLATACSDNYIRIFKEDLESGSEHDPIFRLLVKVKAHEQDCNSVSWNPKISGLLASCSDDRKVKVWQLESENVK